MRSLAAFFIALVAVLTLSKVEAESTFRTPAMGWSSTYFSAYQAMSFDSPGQVAESFAFQQSTNLVVPSNIYGPGPLAGNTYGFPAADGPWQEMVSVTGSMRKITSGNNAAAGQACGAAPCSVKQGSFGMQFIDDWLPGRQGSYPGLNNYVVSGLGLFPPSLTSACAISVTNTTTQYFAGGNPVDPFAFYTFPLATVDTSLNPAGKIGCVVDDVAIDVNTYNYGDRVDVYATDYFGYRILKVSGMQPTNRFGGGTATVLSTSSLLCTGSGPSACSGTGATAGSNGPNGIVIWTDTNPGALIQKWLLINVAPNRLVKMNMMDGTVTEVMVGKSSPLGSLIANDGLTMANPFGGSAVLFASGYPFGPVAGVQGTVSSVTSTDGWSTYEVRTVYNANCPAPSWYDPAVRVQTGTDNVLVMCNNNFQGGLQQINVLQGVASAPIAATIQTIVNGTNIQAESFGYDPKLNMLVLGSISTGAITGYPYNWLGDGGSVRAYGNTDKHTYLPSESPAVSYLGININPGNVFGDNCYALACQGGFNPAVTRLCLINLCTNKKVQCADLPRANPSTVSSANDVTVLGGVAYVSDWLGSLVWAVDISGLSLGAARIVVAAGTCASNAATQCTSKTDGMATVTQDMWGNALADPFILVSSIAKNAAGDPGGLFKFIPSSGALTYVTDLTNVITGLDGMKFNAAGTILYATRNSLAGVNYNTVVAAISCDGWASMQLVHTFQTNCGSNSPALALIKNVNGEEDLVILCNAGFGPGPYSVETVTNVNTKIYNGNANMCGAPPAPAAAPAERAKTNVAGPVLGGVFGGLAAIGIIYYFYFQSKKTAALAAADAATTGSKV